MNERQEAEDLREVEREVDRQEVEVVTEGLKEIKRHCERLQAKKKKLAKRAMALVLQNYADKQAMNRVQINMEMKPGKASLTLQKAWHRFPRMTFNYFLINLQKYIKDVPYDQLFPNRRHHQVKDPDENDEVYTGGGQLVATGEGEKDPVTREWIPYAKWERHGLGKLENHGGSMFEGLFFNGELTGWGRALHVVPLYPEDSDHVSYYSQEGMWWNGSLIRKPGKKIHWD